MDRQYVAKVEFKGGVRADYRTHKNMRNRIYNFYVQTTKKLPKEMTRTKYWKVVRKFNDLMVEEMFNNRPYSLPHGLGKLQIVKKHLPPKMVDGELRSPKIWQGGKFDYVDLSSTNWYVWMITWIKKKRQTSENVRYYKFKAKMNIKKRLCEMIKKGEAYKFDDR